MSDQAFFVLVCRECVPDWTPATGGEMPFTSPEERGRWAAAHRDATGHDRWLVIDLP